MVEYGTYDNIESRFFKYSIDELENLVKSGKIKVISDLNYDSDDLSIDKNLNTFKLDNTLFLNLLTSEFDSKQKATFNEIGLYVYHEKSSEYDIDTWWIGYDKGDAYETHVYKYNDDLLISMTNHNDFKSQFKVFYGFDDFIKYFNN